MKLTNYLKDQIIIDFKAEDKTSALKSLCRLAAERHALNYEKTFKVVMDRELMGSTGIGGGVALPHGKSSETTGSCVLMAVSKKGIDFDSIDGAPVRLFVLLLTSKDGEGREHLQLLATLGRFLKSKYVVDKILGAATADEIFELLQEREL